MSSPYLILGVVAGVLGGKYLFSLPGPRAWAFRQGDKLESITGVAPIVSSESTIESSAELGREFE